MVKNFYEFINAFIPNKEKEHIESVTIYDYPKYILDNPTKEEKEFIAKYPIYINKRNRFLKLYFQKRLIHKWSDEMKRDFINYPLRSTENVDNLPFVFIKTNLKMIEIIRKDNKADVVCREHLDISLFLDEKKST